MSAYPSASLARRNPDMASDLHALRDGCRSVIDDRAAIQSAAADKSGVLRLLNQALGTALICALRYRRHYFMADGLSDESIRKVFLAHARQGQECADQIAERIVSMGGDPNFNVRGQAFHRTAGYHRGVSPDGMIRENLAAGRLAIQSCRRMVRELEGEDVTTRRLLEGILSVAEAHADQLERMLTNPNGPARTQP